MVVFPYGVEICIYCPTFSGVTIFCGFLLLRPVFTDLGSLLSYLGYYLLPLDISKKGKGLGLEIVERALCSLVVLANPLH